MYAPLVEKARTRRLVALASLPQRTGNVIMLSRQRATRQLTAASLSFVSVRSSSAPVRLAA